MKHILRCRACGAYTMHEKCPGCGQEAIRPIPPKYSPLDKYGSYRRKAKLQSLKKANLI
ncbi:RNA-protein complex protein Nop10 [Candidatus Woesearchaeota archaeon]|nr:RNA-protein complex protein Nop10 [Candidatus Woesearchaeota archaeon]